MRWLADSLKNFGQQTARAESVYVSSRPLAAARRLGLSTSQFGSGSVAGLWGRATRVGKVTLGRIPALKSARATICRARRGRLVAIVVAPVRPWPGGGEVSLRTTRSGSDVQRGVPTSSAI